MNHQQGEPPKLLTVPEAMQQLQVSRWTLYNLIRSGDLESVTIGRCRRIPQRALDTFIQRLSEEAGLSCERCFWLDTPGCGPAGGTP